MSAIGAKRILGLVGPGLLGTRRSPRRLPLEGLRCPEVQVARPGKFRLPGIENLLAQDVLQFRTLVDDPAHNDVHRVGPKDLRELEEHPDRRAGATVHPGLDVDRGAVVQFMDQMVTADLGLRHAVLEVSGEQDGLEHVILI